MIESVQNNFQSIKYKETSTFNTLSKKHYSKYNADNQRRNEKITPNEGLKLFYQGLVSQGKDTINSIIKNPKSALISFLGISAGLSLLPFAGIPTVVGGGVLAISFAGIAAGKAVYHAIQFTEAYKTGENDIARNKLEQVGRDSFDITISAPFVPKALINSQKFAKYGKIQIDKDLISRILNKSSITEKYTILKDSDTYLYRHINFQTAVDRELALINDMTDAEKLNIKKELLEYNIPEKDIPKYVLVKEGLKEGITVIPDTSYASLPKNTQGYVSQQDCAIVFNDFKNPHLKDIVDNVVMIQKQTQGNTVKAKFKDIKTGQIYDETIDAALLNEYHSRCESYKHLTPQAKRILTTLHEREHIMQFARLIQMKDFGVIKNLSTRGKHLYEKIINQIPQVKIGTPEAIEAESLNSFTINPTILNYIKRPFEIAARRVEYSLLDNPVFKKLNTVFEYTNKNSKFSIPETIFMTDARFESIKLNGKTK